MMLIVRLMWSLTAQRRLAIITRTLTRVSSRGGLVGWWWGGLGLGWGVGGARY